MAAGLGARFQDEGPPLADAGEASIRSVHSAAGRLGHQVPREGARASRPEGPRAQRGHDANPIGKVTARCDGIGSLLHAAGITAPSVSSPTE